MTTADNYKTSTRLDQARQSQDKTNPSQGKTTTRQDNHKTRPPQDKTTTRQRQM